MASAEIAHGQVAFFNPAAGGLGYFKSPLRG
jgi:hypothetical protein